MDKAHLEMEGEMIRETITENGKIRGIEAADPRITAFKGIPFAAPPVGKNRWRAPQPCENWEGVLPCYRFAPIAMQDTPGIGEGLYNREWHVDPNIDMAEDCLYLNVWTGAQSTEDKLPVLVWFFGGALQWGYPSEMEFDGERLARRGVIVVTVNYRINVFGFMSHLDITKEQPEAPANFGNLDQQSGLQWVIRNIASFGGDPKNITIAGQSAGGGSVLSQIACPNNWGTFQRAIIASAMIRSPYGEGAIGKPQTLEEAQKNGVNFLKFIGANSLQEARQMDAIYIRDQYTEFAKKYPRMGTVIDHKFCIGDPLKLYMQNKHAMVPILAGNTEDEFPNFIHADSEEEYREKVDHIFHAYADEFLQFKEAWIKDEHNNYATVSGIECTVKSVFLNNKEYGNPENCYYYRFKPEIPGWDHPGTFHSVDLWFFFETLAKCWRPFIGKHYDLARQMCNYWANFVKTGDPNGIDADGSAMPEWIPYTKETPYNMLFTTDGARLEEREESEFMKFLIQRITEQI